MSYWKIGVGLPILNNSFGWGTRIYAKTDPPLVFDFQSGVTGHHTVLGSSSFYYDEDYGTDIGLSDGLIKFLRSGDRIRIGPSSWVGYEGAFEDFTITGVSDSIISCDAGADVIFGADDPIVGIGTNCPGGWIPLEQGTLTMGGITNHSEVQLTTSPGYLDRHSLQIRGTGSGQNGVRWYFNQDDYVPNTYYRMGYYYQFHETSGSGVVGTNLIINSGQYLSNNTSIEASEWTEQPGVVSSQTPSSTNSTFYLELATTSTATPGGNVVINFDHVYVEHASQTDDESSGVYTFDDYPQLGSRQFKTLGSSKYFRLANKRLVRNSVGNDTYKRYMVSASFKDVSISLRDNLEVLVDWQDLGSPLVLHHDIPSVPPNLYGIMTVKDTAMGHWSGGVCSFSIDFEEL